MIRFICFAVDYVYDNHCTCVLQPASNLRLGHGPAEFTLGKCYLDGHGVVRDDDTGVMWVLRAAKWAADPPDETSAEANWILAQCYAQGRGVERDAEAAAEYFLRVGTR